MLLTDGLANVGITDPEILAQHALELSRRGVSTSTFGVGLDYNHHLLEAMANQGGGSYYYIEEPRDIPNIFAREFREIAAATAADVAVYLTLPEGLRPIVLGGWRTETSEDQLRIDLGALYSGREQPIYVKLQLDPGSDQADLLVKAIVRGKLINGMLSEAEARVVFKLADQAAVDAARRDQSVLERCAKVEMADQTIEALKLEREGRREQAAQLMKDSINNILPTSQAGRTAKL